MRDEDGWFEGLGVLEMRDEGLADGVRGVMRPIVSMCTISGTVMYRSCTAYPHAQQCTAPMLHCSMYCMYRYTILHHCSTMHCSIAAVLHVPQCAAAVLHHCM